MRRGQTLIELLAALAVLAVIGSVALRLLFTADRVLAGPTQRAAHTGSQADLLADLGEDLPPARAVSGGEGELRFSGPQAGRYYWDEARQATVRESADPRLYPGVHLSCETTGRLVRVRLEAGGTVVRTAFYLRNG